MTQQFVQAKVALEQQRERYERLAAADGHGSAAELLAENAALIEQLNRLQERACSAEMRSAHKNSRVASLRKKMRNRDQNLSIMEKALAEYQELYRTSVISNQERFNALEQELAHAKSMIARMHMERSASPTTRTASVGSARDLGSARRYGSPAIVKPMRGGGGSGRKASAAQVSSTVSDSTSSSSSFLGGGMRALGSFNGPLTKQSFGSIFSRALSRTKRAMGVGTGSEARESGPSIDSLALADYRKRGGYHRRFYEGESPGRIAHKREAPPPAPERPLLASVRPPSASTSIGAIDERVNSPSSDDITATSTVHTGPPPIGESDEGATAVTSMPMHESEDKENAGEVADEVKPGGAVKRGNAACVDNISTSRPENFEL